MGAYAVPDNRRFVSSKPLPRKRKITEEQREMIEFFNTHNFEGYIDEKTGLGAFRVTQKAQEPDEDNE